MQNTYWDVVLKQEIAQGWYCYPPPPPFRGFTEVRILPLFLVMTSLWRYFYRWALKLAYFVEHKISYQPCKFNSLGCLDLILQRTDGKHPPPPPPRAVPEEKSPVLLRLRVLYVSYVCMKLGEGRGEKPEKDGRRKRGAFPKM